MVDVREARYFVAVAEELHFGRAAERLHMSQPPLSQVVKALKSRLGVQLLARSTREVRLTPAGAVFLDRCRTVIAAVHAADAAARRAAMGQVGELRISAVTSAFVDPLPAILADFQDSHPDVDIRLDEVDTHVAVQALRRGETDVALVRQLATPLDCRRTTLRRENFVLAVPRVWAERADQAWTLQSVADLPWIWLPRAISPDYHDQVVACCRTAGFSPQARHTARSITSQLAMVASGLGVALVPESATRHVHDAHPATDFVTLDRPTTIELAAVWHRDENVLVDAFLASARHAS